MATTKYALQNLESCCDNIISCVRIVCLIFNFSPLKESPQTLWVTNRDKSGFIILIYKKQKDWGVGGLPSCMIYHFWLAKRSVHLWIEQGNTIFSLCRLICFWKVLRIGCGHHACVMWEYPSLVDWECFWKWQYMTSK